MKRYAREGVRVGDKYGGRGAAILNVRTVRADIQNCVDCGEHFRPRGEPHIYCQQCYPMRQLCRGLDAYSANNIRPNGDRL